MSNPDPQLEREGWPVTPPSRRWPLLVVLVALVLLGFSFHRMGLMDPIGDTAEGLGVKLFGIEGSSQVVDGAVQFFERGWPPEIARVRDVNRIEGFDPENLPLFSHIEMREETSVELAVVDGKVVQTEVTEATQVLVEPVGYLYRVGWLMLETFEIAVWGTVFSLLLAVPLGALASNRLTPIKPLVTLARSICSLIRAIPELISAMFFVLMFGFGPVAGILALGCHSAGFLGKFFADDLDNSDPGPANAISASGVGRLGTFRHAMLPLVAPQYMAYLQYILERNVRTATVLGIVGAGGIGMELLGKWTNFQYGHATTVLIAIFLTVVALEALTQYSRRKLISD
ncbi:MAG: phosphate/phosphonate ABC transporter permease [Phycisphaeraceae bacterium]|nr:phosphate/phosphonate ABC transporter permease [Phycisphaeraceae bacterium]